MNLFKQHVHADRGLYLLLIEATRLTCILIKYYLMLLIVKHIVCGAAEFYNKF